MKSILLVDDKIDIQEILADFLRNSGHKTSAYADGEQALKRITDHNEKYDLIITDIIMPKKDGMTFLKELRALPQQAQNPTPVIMMTGGSTSVDFQEKLEKIASQGNKVLKKPFTKDQFIAAVNKSLNIKT